MTTLSTIYSKPLNPKIEIGTEKSSIITPYAYEHKGNWLYNWQGAMDEAKFRWERPPTIDELLEEINSIKGDCIEKAKALNIPFAGYRDADLGKFAGEGVVAYLWSASPGGVGSALYVYLHRVNANANVYWNDRGHGFQVRSFLDKSESSDSSTLWNLDSIIEELKEIATINDSQTYRIREVMNLISNL